jgi:hypothetical protein
LACSLALTGAECASALQHFSWNPPVLASVEHAHTFVIVYIVELTVTVELPDGGQGGLSRGGATNGFADLSESDDC